MAINLNFPEACVKEIDATYDQLIIMLDREGMLEELASCE